MKVEITIKVDGQVVTKHLEQVDGTLENMEETIDALSRRVACDTLQASVNSLPQSRPLFRQTAADSDIKAINPEHSSD